MSIEKRLREIVAEENRQWLETKAWDSDRLNKKIIQAFKDDGWIQLESPTETQRREWEEAHKVMKGDLMTGQEWYDRFEKELKKLVGDERMWTLDAIDAAKRASGIEGEE